MNKLRPDQLEFYEDLLKGDTVRAEMFAEWIIDTHATRFDLQECELLEKHGLDPRGKSLTHYGVGEETIIKVTFFGGIVYYAYVDGDHDIMISQTLSDILDAHFEFFED